ncbi:MAG: hypothetical protein WB778_09110 [Thermoplasmata archaeon]
MVGNPAVEAQPELTVDMQAFAYYNLRMTVRDESIAFVAKPIRVRTRKGKDYHVIRITVPKSVIERLNPESDDYLFLRVKIAQWFQMVNWANLPKVWRKLPHALQREVLASNVFSPSTLASLPGMIGHPPLAAPTATSAPQALVSASGLEVNPT